MYVKKHDKYRILSPHKVSFITEQNGYHSNLEIIPVREENSVLFENLAIFRLLTTVEIIITPG